MKEIIVQLITGSDLLGTAEEQDNVEVFLVRVVGDTYRACIDKMKNCLLLQLTAISVSGYKMQIISPKKADRLVESGAIRFGRILSEGEFECYVQGFCALAANHEQKEMQDYFRECERLLEKL